MNNNNNTERNTMNFNEIKKLADETRDETYGLLVGTDPRFGHEAICFLKDVKHTGPKEKLESAHKKFKREKAENVQIYTKSVEATGKIDFSDALNRNEMSQHRSEMAFVSMAVKAGMIDAIDEDDLLEG